MGAITNWETALRSIAPPPNTARRVICPACQGGSTQEACMSVWTDVEGNVSARCWRSKCGKTFGAERAAPRTAREPRYFTRPTQSLTQEQEDMLWARFGLPNGTVKSYDARSDRFVLPVTGPNYQARGVISYSLSGASPKSLTYNELPDQPFVHWSTHGIGPLVVVEDWFSAEKVATTGRAVGVALMGTTLSNETAAELAAAKRPVILAFDADAYAKSVAYLQRFGPLWSHGSRVWRLSRDLKYVPADRIARALDGGEYFSGNDANEGSL